VVLLELRNEKKQKMKFKALAAAVICATSSLCAPAVVAINPVAFANPITHTLHHGTPHAPKPERYAMLLIGLGLMGAIARRRHKTRGT